MTLPPPVFTAIALTVPPVTVTITGNELTLNCATVLTGTAGALTGVFGAWLTISLQVAGHGMVTVLVRTYLLSAMSGRGEHHRVRFRHDGIVHPRAVRARTTRRA